jgi:hypothetical protein
VRSRYSDPVRVGQFEFRIPVGARGYSSSVVALTTHRNLRPRSVSIYLDETVNSEVNFYCIHYLGQKSCNRES